MIGRAKSCFYQVIVIVSLTLVSTIKERIGFTEGCGQGVATINKIKPNILRGFEHLGLGMQLFNLVP